MKLKTTLYPKTKRLDPKRGQVVITEKLDGSNLSFFKLNGKLHIAQRGWILSLYRAIMESSNLLYKGLFGWLEEYGSTLEAELQDGACICGEWLGMSRISYGDRGLPRFNQFAKANITEDYSLKNLYYDQELFKWSYRARCIPEYIGVVPTVEILDHIPTVDELDELYADYIPSVSSDVEGFIIFANGGITKYIRMKNGELEDHRS